MRRRAAIHAALADPGRLAIVDQPTARRCVSHRSSGPSLEMPSNLMAHHLKVLADAGLVQRTRSEADRRRTYLRLNHQRPGIHDSVGKAQRAPRGVRLHAELRAQPDGRRDLEPPQPRPRNIGRHTSRRLGPPRCRRRHAPAQRTDPTPRPRHLDEVLADDDLLIAVCDNAHEELPPTLERLHWSIPDPVRSSASDPFDHAFDDLNTRIDRFTTSLQPA